MKKIATITLKNGKVNAISHQVIAEINDALDQAESAGAVVILTAQPGIFSAGFDLKTMKESSESAVALSYCGLYFVSSYVVISFANYRRRVLVMLLLRGHFYY